MSAIACSAFAQGAAPSEAARAKYEKDRAACMALGNASQVDKEACLKEAGAVFNERKDGKMPGTAQDPGALQQNALQRCANVAPKDRADCESRAKGGGVKEGSVSGGGMIKESVTTQVLPRGASVPEGSTQVGTIPGAVIPAPPSFASSPQK